ncbi:MAG: Crp/Fnr family transcriptional regulator [Bacteroidetes bacterium]|nr:Crp/Fnr family transcriptional regulator [Bacteroidota bacterium]MBI3481616.1 Crp/Fnr family transcriptional regulator [Bacteroidota bacterium]
MQQLLNYIAKYITLTPEEERVLLSKVKARKFLKGQFVVQQGDVCKTENFVLSGCLKTFHIDHEGQEHIVMLAIENWWTSDLGSYINQTPADFNVQCLENSEVAQILYEDLERLFVEIPKLERFFRIIIQKAFAAAQKRIVNNFSLPAKERYLKFREQYPQIEQRVPQYMIASYLGMTKEFLSKIRSQLIEEQ